MSLTTKMVSHENKDLEELEGEDLLDGHRNKWELLQQELEDLAKPTPYEHISKKMTAKEWIQWAVSHPWRRKRTVHHRVRRRT